MIDRAPSSSSIGVRAALAGLLLLAIGPSATFASPAERLGRSSAASPNAPPGEPPVCGQWSQANSGEGLLGRAFTYSIHDPVRRRLIAFGGEYTGTTSTSYLNELLAYAYDTNTWSVIAAVGSSPSPRARGAAVYDPIRDRMILFGGFDGTNVLHDIWSLSLSGTPVWTLLDAGAGPAARHGHSAIYDPERDRMLVFGGETPAVSSELWSLSLASAPSWTPVSGPGGPSPRSGAAMAYDPGRDRLIVFGGTAPGQPELGDLWTLPLSSASSWTSHHPPSGLPEPQSFTAAMFDPARDRLVLHGGGRDGPGTWAVAFEHGPQSVDLTDADQGDTSDRRGHAAAFVPDLDQWLVFGGFSSGHRRDVSRVAFGIEADVAIVPPASGRVMRTPEGCVAPGDDVVFTAQPSNGWAFDHWSGDGSGTNPVIERELTGYEVLVAHFVAASTAITWFSPTQAPAYSPVTIEGVGFTGATEVAFNGIPADFSVSRDTHIYALVPPGATTGPIRVTGPRGVATSDAAFVVEPNPVGGMNLSWDACGPDGSNTKAFACDANVGEPFELVASFVPPSGLDEFRGLDAQIDLRAPSGVLPDWWKHGSDACRGTQGLTLDLTAPPGCDDIHGGQGTGGFVYEAGARGPDHARLRVVVGPSDLSPITSGTEYHAFTMRVARSSTHGTGACSGCPQTLCIVMNEMRLFEGVEGRLHSVLTLPWDRSFVSWQGTVATCPFSTPAQAAVVASDATHERVRIEWHVPQPVDVAVERRRDAGTWRRIATRTPDGARRVAVEDRDIDAGATYAYRLAISEDGGVRHVGEITVQVPARSPLALGAPTWDPQSRNASFAVTMPHAGDAHLEVFDLAGRRRLRNRFEGLVAGANEVRVLAAHPLASGVYFARLVHGGESVVRRFVLGP